MERVINLGIFQPLTESYRYRKVFNKNAKCEVAINKISIRVARESIGVIDWLYRYFGERSRETENFITSRMKTAQESKTPRKSITATYIIRGS
ncbi:hypothetical protein U3516DRAFT_780611 [Neocallimastix sp. 'constans']